MQTRNRTIIPGRDKMSKITPGNFVWRMTWMSQALQELHEWSNIKGTWNKKSKQLAQSIDNTEFKHVISFTTNWQPQRRWCQATSSCTSVCSPLIFCFEPWGSSKDLSIPIRNHQWLCHHECIQRKSKEFLVIWMHQRHCLDSLIGSRCSHTSSIGSCKSPHIFSMIWTTSFGGSCNQKAQRIRTFMNHTPNPAAEN